QKLRQRLAEAEDVTSLLSSPGIQFVDLKGVDPNPQAFGKVVLDPEKGKAVVYMYRLPQTPQGKHYQLWVMREGKPTSAGVFTVAADGSAALKLDRLPEPDGFSSFLVTIEPEGGQIAPTGMMYLTGPAPSEKN
ncbi:MAG: anti-sigma factor, partial [Limisphaerales bacterium]